MSFTFVDEDHGKDDVVPSVNDDDSISVSFPSAPTGDGLFCTYCGKDDFTTERGLKIHLTRMHGAGGDSQPRSGKKGSKKSSVSMQEEIQATYYMIGAVVGFFQQKDAAVIFEHAEQCAIAWDAACQKNEKIRKAWSSVTTVSVWAQLMTAHAPIVMGIMANHQIAPDISTLTAETSEHHFRSNDEADEYFVATAESSYQADGYIE
jgi:hypothetical protein